MPYNQAYNLFSFSSLTTFRSVFKILQKTLDDTQDDERFSTYNVASHNSGVENIKSSLKFLDSIFGRVQSHVQGNHKNLPALTA